MPSTELFFPPNLMGPFSLVQSRTLDLEIVEKLEKVLKGCQKLHVFLVKNIRGKKWTQNDKNLRVKRILL